MTDPSETICLWDSSSGDCSYNDDASGSLFSILVR